MRRNHRGEGIRHFSVFPKFLFSLSLFFWAALPFCACGLDTYYVLDRAPRVERRIDYTEVDPALKYFEFYSAENSNSGNSEFRFLGTYVYYKIYSSSSKMLSNHDYIEAVNNSLNYSAAAERMLGLGYQELYTDKGSRSPFVPYSSPADEKVDVLIRLTNFLETKDPIIDNIKTDAQINIGGIYSGTPRRSIGESYSFDFGRYGNSTYEGHGISYNHPTSSDDDFSDGTVSDKKYYVDMYAVAAGRDTTFRKYYSNVTYLGSVTIDAEDPYN